MKMILKWAGILLALVILLVAVSYFVITSRAADKLNTKHEIAVEAITIPDDSASLARGKHLSEILCLECHGGQYRGKLFINEPQLAVVYSPNLTAGTGGIGAEYTIDDWIRAIRHGVSREGRALFVMPSKDFAHMTEEDLGSVIAYMQTLKPVDHEIQPPQFGSLGKVLVGSGAIAGALSVESIDHSAPFPDTPNRSDPLAIGKYLTDISGCRTCHGNALEGMQEPSPGSKPAPNLTPGGRMGNWSEQEFLHAMRTGITPEGINLDPEQMPFLSYGRMTNKELKAMYQYLMSLESISSSS